MPLKPPVALLLLLAACAAPPPPPTRRTELPLRVRWVRAERGDGTVRLVGRVEWSHGLLDPLTVSVRPPKGAGPHAQALVRRTLPASARAGAHEVEVTLDDAEGAVLVADVQGEGYGVHAEVTWTERAPAPAVRPHPSGRALP